MKTLNRAIALIMALLLASSSLMCLAAEGEKVYCEYEKVMLLGDSEASGFTDYGDEMSEFTYVPDSYAAYVADELGAELIPMACPGFRTIELRYMLDDSYRPDDKYLFAEVPRTPTDEIIAKSPEMRQAIKESDLIMIGIGGNDWGAYLGWIMEDVQFENNLPEEYKQKLREFLAEATFEDDIIGKMIELADYCNALDELALALPEALNYAFSNLWENWDYIVEYIYENNPDVTLVVVGMFPTYLKTEEGAPDVVAEPDPLAVIVEDEMIAFGNKHMIENQEKYGYIYVDTAGTVVEICHPTVAGHRHIADRILEALPDGRFAYGEDVSIRAPYYEAVEYMTVNGYMNGTGDTTFGPDEALTKDVLSDALGKIKGYGTVTDSTDKVTDIYMALTLLRSVERENIFTVFKALKFAAEIILSRDLIITRAEGAEILYSYMQNFA